MALLDKFLVFVLIEIVSVNSVPLSPEVIQSIPNTLKATVPPSDSKSLSEQSSPCQQSEEVSSKIHQLVYENILNNPTVLGILNPSVQHEIQLHEIPNNCLTSSAPSIINNYIIIPPEAFKDEPKYIIKRYSEPKPKKRRTRRKNPKLESTRSPNLEHENVVIEKTSEPKQETTGSPKLEHENVVIEKTSEPKQETTGSPKLEHENVVIEKKSTKEESTKSNLRVKEHTARIKSSKNNNKKTQRKNDIPCNCQTPQNSFCPRNDASLLSFCDILDVLKEYKSCPENRLIRNTNQHMQPVNQFTPTRTPNQIQQRPFKRPEDTKTSKKAHFNPQTPPTPMYPGSHITFPNFAPYYSYPNYLFNYPPMYGNMPNMFNTKTNNTPKSSSLNNVKPVQTQTRTKPKSINHSQTSKKSMVLNVKVDNSTNVINTTSVNVGGKKEIHISLSAHLNKAKEKVPNLNQTAESDSGYDNISLTTTESPFAGNESEISEVTSTTIEPKKTIEIINSTEIIETTTLKDTKINSTKGEIEETTSFDLLAKYQENISVPELGSEDELPNIEENDLMEDYYPDFHKDNKAYLEKSVLNQKDSKKKENNQVGEKEIPRVVIKNRHYYEIEEHGFEDDKPEKIILPKLLTTTTTVKTLDESTSSTVPITRQEKGFITPPTLTKIDFETKQINKKKGPSHLDDDNLSSSKPEVVYKGSAYSETKTPQYSVRLKPYEELKLTIVPEEFKRKPNIETVFANSKVVNYGAGQESMEDTVERPQEEYSDESEEYSSKYTSDGPFVVIAKSIGNEEELW